MIVGYYALRYLISIHALREESDLRTLCVDCPADRISIHALREESDDWYNAAQAWSQIFQSTPSARRATLQPGGSPA